MRRVTAAALIVGVAFAMIVLSGGHWGVAEFLIVLAVVLATGIGPFAFGVVVRLLWKNESVPLAVPWVFGAALGLIRFVAPQLGGLTVMNSKPLAVLFTVALGGAFAELGIAGASAILLRRKARNVASPEA